jgi:type IV pilus assembly protein PilA
MRVVGTLLNLYAHRNCLALERSIMKCKITSCGFTLIELLVVVAIIAILCMIALPAPDPSFARKQVAESLALIEDYKKALAESYKILPEFPQDNTAAGIPKAELLIGNFVDKIELSEGAFHLHFGNRAHPALKNKFLSVRPIVVKGSPQSPMSWICGFSAVPEGMKAIGADKTNVELQYLPLSCRI